MTGVQVYGVRGTLTELRKLDKDAHRAAITAVKRAAQPLAKAIQAGFPSSAPLSGFDHAGRTGWNARGARRATVKYGGKSRRDRNSWPLVRVTVTGAAASIYDMAGRGSGGRTAQGIALVDALPGSASRVVWPIAERMLPEISAAVTSELKRVETETSARLKAR